MARVVENLSGRRFGRLVARERAENNKRGNARWICDCDCGAETVVIGSALRGDWISSCGCAGVDTRTVHGHRKRLNSSSEYSIWRGMIKRCRNKASRKYKNYGGRGIRVCERWRDFRNFLADMGPRPSEDYSLDRFPDNDGDYEPDNCRWATRRQQGRNMRSNRIVVFEGERMALAEAAERAGVRYTTAWRRLNDGWSVERALPSPPGRMDCLMPAGLL